MIRFYTLPPSDADWPYILINANNPALGYIRKHRKAIKSVIVDSGIEIFRNPEVKDYPKGHIYRIVKLHNYLRRVLPDAEVYATVPDYCDDYHPRNLWLSTEVTNIERTFQNVIKYTEEFDYVNWLIPVQGWNKQPKSIERCIRLYQGSGILSEFDYFAIGNLCVEPDVMTIYATYWLARKLLPDKKLHVFGLKLRALRLVKGFIDSFDSTAWTRPVNSKLGNWSCKNSEERKRFFYAWISRLNEILSQKTLLEVAKECVNAAN